ncbi:ABC transporter permease [Cognatishimia sp. MH4019]|uniref:ABC transporter permease n=1 Tax=Cognatishimia sp. MH4019 TaxID=2854030 RepID=UPI001CD28EAB|nr:ABC transporter permease [Cognatishimia sp. MH4019]
MSEKLEMGTRRFGRWNWLGTKTLAEREIRRFLNVWAQTLAAPLVTAGLFLLIFALAVGPQRGDVMGVPFVTFVAPGLLMMTVIQNAFANTSSSIVSAKVQGNIVDTLMPPLSPLELVMGYVTGGIARGLFVAVSIALGMLLFLGISVAHPIWLLVFAIVGSAVMAGLGIIAAVFARKFDQMAAITNFIITPLAFLSGTFYSLETIPPVLATLIHWNPMFYMIDGARYGVLGVSDSDPRLGLVICLVTAAFVLSVCWRWFKSGYRIKS